MEKAVTDSAVSNVYVKWFVFSCLGVEVFKSINAVVMQEE